MSQSRLFKIVYYLLDKGQATAPELAEKFEVSVRTIYRDVDTLSSAGVPIYVTTGRNGGIKILDHYTLNKSFFTDQERELIISSLQSLSALSQPETETILNKLGALFQTSTIDWIEVDFSRWGADPEKENRLFDNLKQAVLAKRVVAFDYFSAKGKSQRSVNPLKLIYKDKAWYLYSFCLEKQDYRLFRLSRIKHLQILETTFKRTTFDSDRSDGQPEQFGPLMEVELLFAKEVGAGVYDLFAEEMINVEKDGYRVKASLPKNYWLYSILMSFGPKVTIIQPDSLRQEIIRGYEEILAHHKKAAGNV